MIKEKISDGFYYIYPSTPPDTVELNIYRGDHFSFTLQGFNIDDTPFNFTTFTDFRADIRVGDPRNKKSVYSFEWSKDNAPGDEFVLGKSNPNVNIFDELSLISDKATDFCKPYPVLWMDIEGIIAYNITSTQQIKESTTLIRVKLVNEPDVTRQ